MSVSKVRLSARVIRQFSTSNKAEPIVPDAEYCADLVRLRDRESFWATKLLKSQLQERIIPILAFNVEVSIIRQKIVRNSGVTGIYQLQFWKDALNTLVGKMKGPIPRQPVVKELARLGVVTERNVDLFQDLVAARQDTLGDRPFETMEAMQENSRRVYGTLIRLNALEMQPGEEIPAVRTAAEKMGVALGVATLLRATIPLLKEGTVLLPLDLLDMHGLRPESFVRAPAEEALRSVVKHLFLMSTRNMQEARDLKRHIPKNIRPAFLSAGVRTDHVLKILERTQYNILASQLQMLPLFLTTNLWFRYKLGRF